MALRYLEANHFPRTLKSCQCSCRNPSCALCQARQDICFHAPGFQPCSACHSSCLHTEAGFDLKTRTDTTSEFQSHVAFNGRTTQSLLIAHPPLEKTNLICSSRFDASPRASSDASPVPVWTQRFFKPKHFKPKQRQHLARHRPASLQVGSICCWQWLSGQSRLPLHRAETIHAVRRPEELCIKGYECKSTDPQWKSP